MKVTLQIPDLLFHRAKSVSAERGIPFAKFVPEAVQDKLNLASSAKTKPWMKHFGKLKQLHKETKQIEQRIEEAFEEVDSEG